MVFPVRLEMIPELLNTFAEDRYLYFWRTGVGFVKLILCNYTLF